MTGSAYFTVLRSMTQDPEILRAAERAEAEIVSEGNVRATLAVVDARLSDDDLDDLVTED